ncbi:hypothetical protein RFI_12970 [Reticulomyxa filosa]|uniref:Uncharacterized protein n=1 Tax=Reticulomyxa filosa TaxID=46433 RepID=X6NCY5_RETFI|nr:hypothetical protein RFI_12970 [Reticulomyxa filosa]|eukprot:ETO24190.1 hypothetical protein RFI_12970 [Reticulomyxa filosa]
MLVKSAKRTPCVIAWCPVSEDAGFQHKKRKDNSYLRNHNLLALGKTSFDAKQFQSRSFLEIVDTSMGNTEKDKMSTLGLVQVHNDVKIASISWSTCSQDGFATSSYPLGLIAKKMEREEEGGKEIKPTNMIYYKNWKGDDEKGVGLDNGDVQIWDANLLIENNKNEKEAILNELKCHEGTAQVQWNSLQPKLLATCGREGKACIWNFEDINSPSQSIIHGKH